MLPTLRDAANARLPHLPRAALALFMAHFKKGAGIWSNASQYVDGTLLQYTY
jgi:hypothetical protein